MCSLMHGRCLLKTWPLALRDFTVREIEDGRLDWSLLVTLYFVPTSLGVPLLPPCVFKLYVGLRLTGDIG
jgi:hypothetical protein